MTAFTVQSIPPTTGFRPASFNDPFLDHVGPFYIKDDDEGGLIVAIHAANQHINQYGRVHGGMLATLADVAIGFNINGASSEASPTFTLNLSTDFVSAAHQGEWVEAHVKLTKKHGRILFGECHIRIADRTIVSAHAVFISP